MQCHPEHGKGSTKEQPTSWQRLRKVVIPLAELSRVPPTVSRIISFTRLTRGSSIVSRYRRTTLPSMLGCKCSVLPLSAIGRRKSFLRMAFASSVFLNPPGVCLWSLLLPPRARRPPWEIQSDLAAALPLTIHK